MIGLLAIFILNGQKKSCGLAWQCRMTLGLDAQVLDDNVTRFNSVFHKEAVAYGVVGNIVFDQQVIRGMYRHAAVVGVVNRGVLECIARSRRR